MKRMMSTVLCVVPLVVLIACAGEDGVDVSDRDARCVAACTAEEPRYEGVGKICDAASRVQCLDECETRIAGVSTVCQNCLVEDACFGPDGCYGDDVGLSCINNTCTVSSEFGTCSFNPNDEAAKLKCYQQVDPRREATCTSRFQPTSECAAVCI